MKAYVITILSNIRSVAAAKRCRESGEKHGICVENFNAVTPADKPLELMDLNGWEVHDMLDTPAMIKGFHGNKYSRLLPCVSAFVSHSMLWRTCRDWGDPLIVCEHDAVFTRPLPDLSGVTHLCNLGAPSFGKFKTPKPGIGPLVSKAFLPGAHCYYVTPAGAAALLEKAKTEACPTDVFIHTKRFPWLQEACPWPAEAQDDFTTIQQPEGCVAKHRKVEIINP